MNDISKKIDSDIPLSLNIEDKNYIKWRRKSEYIRRNSISYWVLSGELLTNEEMFNQYVLYHYNNNSK